MSERKPGWYWVKIGQDGDWECAEWNGGTWEVTGTDYDWPESRVEMVGPRIPGPDEPWQCVPKHITAEDGYKAALIGEFTESYAERCPECEAMGDEGECIICLGTGEVHVKVPVSWTNIKAIHRRIVELAAAPKPEDV